MVFWRLVNAESFMAFYMDYFYAGVRKLSQLFLHWIPVPVVYFVLPLLIIGLLYFVVRSVRYRDLKSLKYLGSYIFSLYMSFFVVWGFVYSNKTISEQFGLKKVEVNEAWIFDRLNQETVLLDSLQQQYSQNSEVMSPSILENQVRNNLNQFLHSLRLRTFPYVKIRQVKSGLLLRLETMGIYFPYAFEGHYDADIHDIQKPFTACHEMLHGYGYGQEADCNFFAYLTCMQSDNIALQYSGQMAYWRYLASTCRRLNKEKYALFYDSIPENISSDLQEIRATQKVYKPLIGPLRDKFYDFYLKSNGVQGGLKNYSAFINMVESWREKYPNNI